MNRDIFGKRISITIHVFYKWVIIAAQKIKGKFWNDSACDMPALHFLTLQLSCCQDNNAH